MPISTFDYESDSTAIGKRSSSDDVFLRRSKRVKTHQPVYDGSSDLTPASDEEIKVAKGKGKGKKGKSKSKSKASGARAPKSKAMAGTKTTQTVQPRPQPSPMSPSETATLNHLANTMEGNKFWTLDGSGSQRTRSPSHIDRTVADRVAELSNGILVASAAIASAMSTLDQVMGALGVQGADGGIEDKAEAILKHVQRGLEL